MLETQAPRWIQQFVEDHMLVGTVAREKHRWLDSRSVLLTWVGDWGLWRENEKEPRVSVDTVTARVQQSSWAQDLWGGFRRAVEDMALRLRADAWSCSLELCTRTLETAGTVRLHGHAFLKKEASKMTVRTPRMSGLAQQHAKQAGAIGRDTES